MKSAIAAVLCILLLGQGALAQDLYVPPPEPEEQPEPPPKPSPPKPMPVEPTPVEPTSIDGAWRFQSECDTGRYEGVLTFAGSGGTFSGAVKGTLSSVELNGSKVSFKNSYNLFGQVTETWSGQLSKDRDTISGEMGDSTGDHCVFLLQRRTG